MYRLSYQIAVEKCTQITIEIDLNEPLNSKIMNETQILQKQKSRLYTSILCVRRYKFDKKFNYNFDTWKTQTA